MIYGGEATAMSEPKIGILRRHLFERRARIKSTPMGTTPVAHPLSRGPAMLDPIAIVSVPGRTLYECRAKLITSTKSAAPGVPLSRSRCHSRFATPASQRGGFTFYGSLPANQ